MTTSEPGWYDDPNDSNAQRYWDGQDWTPHRQRKPVAQPMPAPVKPAAPPPAPPVLPPANFPPPPPNLPPPPANLPPPPGQQAQWPPPGQPPGGTRPSRSRAAIVILAVVAALAVVGVVGYQYLSTSSNTPEGQIRTLVQTFTDDYNKSDFSGITALTCQTSVIHMDKIRRSRASDGPISTSVSVVHISGERATADVSMSQNQPPHNSDTSTWEFAKETGGWKVCDISSKSA